MKYQISSVKYQENTNFKVPSFIITLLAPSEIFAFIAFLFDTSLVFGFLIFGIYSQHVSRNNQSRCRAACDYLGS